MGSFASYRILFISFSPCSHLDRTDLHRLVSNLMIGGWVSPVNLFTTDPLPAATASQPFEANRTPIPVPSITLAMDVIRRHYNPQDDQQRPPLLNRRSSLLRASYADRTTPRRRFDHHHMFFELADSNTHGVFHSIRQAIIGGFRFLPVLLPTANDSTTPLDMIRRNLFAYRSMTSEECTDLLIDEMRWNRSLRNALDRMEGKSRPTDPTRYDYLTVCSTLFSLALRDSKFVMWPLVNERDGGFIFLRNRKNLERAKNLVLRTLWSSPEELDNASPDSIKLRLSSVLSPNDIIALCAEQSVPLANASYLQKFE